jgi:phenylpropionate dioxygenase-like ring-hydroxylating dioxygenase large terminal subunit
MQSSQFLRNAWYVAAWAGEVGEGQLLNRTYLDEAVLLFRDRAGVAHALADRCPHRAAPLHLGKHCGDTVQCGYHGLQFDARGACVHNPHPPGNLPKAAQVRRYPLEERHSFLWIWMGAESRADAGLIPDFSFQDPATHFVGKRYLKPRVSYLLEIDNIMDLSHIEFLHPTTLGSPEVSRGRYAAETIDDCVWSKRSTANEIMPDFLYRARGIAPGTRCDRWIDVRWHAPANMALFAGAVPSGEPRNSSPGVSQSHVFTPETSSSSHYWFGIAFPKAMGERGAQMAEEQIDGLKYPFEHEDLPMLEAQQSNLSAAASADENEVLLSVDAGGALARRRLFKLIAQENAAAGATT